MSPIARACLRLVLSILSCCITLTGVGLRRMRTLVRGRAWPALVMAAALSCGRPTGPPEQTEDLGTVAQALIDTDSDGMDDDWETAHFGGLSQTASGDFDGDGMTNGQEFTYGFDPALADAFDDADGDRYPNVFEVQGGTNPNSASSTPTPSLVVNAAGGGTHTTIRAALSAVSSQTGDYVIVGIAPGVYTGTGNIGLTASSSTKKLLIIGLEGASKTVIEGTVGVTYSGWDLYDTAIISSLTFRNMPHYALLAYSPTSEFRFIDLLIHDNVTPSYNGGVYVGAAAKTVIAGSTFANNRGAAYAGDQIYFGGSGPALLLNTVVWGTGAGTQLVQAGATLTADHSLVKGQTLTGTGNLGGATDPKLRFDYRPLWDSPLRGAGGATSQSRTDMDLEVRPSINPDVGVDQFIDADADDLADVYEIERSGNLATLASASQDNDGDGLTNQQEYENGTSPVLVDTDGDGLSDSEEVLTYGTNPRSSDSDSDGMPDGFEAAHGLSPLLSDALDDTDGDRYPNIFEYVYGSNPGDRTSTPTPTLIVDGSGGGTHTTIRAALNAVGSQSGDYVIVGIAPGVYTGSDNVSLTTSSSTKKLLIIGLEGASKTVIEGTAGVTYSGWDFYNTTVVSSLTFQKAPHYVLLALSPTSEFRFIDLLIHDNVTTSYNGGVYVNAAAKTVIAGSTFANNRGAAYAGDQIYLGGSGTAVLTNTVVWGTGTGTQLVQAGATLTADHSLVKGQTLAGTGNLSGSTDPKLRFDYRLLWDSPLREAGWASAQSRSDMDMEVRPSSNPDIGVDQFLDTDGDRLPDAWEVMKYGSSTAISGFDDADDDGLSNAEEYARGTDLLAADTDRDGLVDGAEVALGLNPLVSDADDLSGDLNHDGVLDSVGVQLGHQPGQLDDDGDSVSNQDEVAMCLDPFRADSDGDGVPDNLDAFPLDPTVSALTSNPSDVTAPVITLTAPSIAVEQ